MGLGVLPEVQSVTLLCRVNSTADTTCYVRKIDLGINIAAPENARSLCKTVLERL